MEKNQHKEGDGKGIKGKEGDSYIKDDSIKLKVTRNVIPPKENIVGHN